MNITRAAPTHSESRTPPEPMSSQLPGATASIVSGRVVDPARGDHYAGMGMQPLEFIMANDLDFLAGNVVKYVTRGAVGNVDEPLTDLRKARHYLELMIKREESRDSTQVGD